MPMLAHWFQFQAARHSSISTPAWVSFKTGLAFFKTKAIPVLTQTNGPQSLINPFGPPEPIRQHPIT